MSKAKLILKLSEQGFSAAQIAKRTKAKPSYVYFVRSINKKAKAKKPEKANKKLTKTQKALAKRLGIDANVFLEEVVPPDPRAEEWKARNPWWGVDEEKTAQALAYHEKLVRSGVDPKSDEYWKKIDAKFSPDLVNNPPHYKVGGMDTLDFILAKDLNFLLGNAVKYISRAGRKVGSDPVQDLEKAVFYLNREIETRKSA